jgi:hypothetical protein
MMTATTVASWLVPLIAAEIDRLQRKASWPINNMKTELRLCPHSVLRGEKIIEIWYADNFIGTVTGADGPGIRVVSKHDLQPCISPGIINVVEVQVLTQLAPLPL